MWQLECAYVNECFNVNVAGSKRVLTDETSPMLWHKRLGHISRERIITLMKQNMLPQLNFDNFNDCIDCFKGKLTNARKMHATRSQNLLEIIHTDICGPFPNKTICDNTFFVTFIDDFSRYCYLFLILHKSQTLECIKIFKLEAEKQLPKQIKIVRSNRGGEYFGRYTEKGQQLGSFASYLFQEGIMAQYTTPGNPQQNGVAERRNRTLKDIW